MNISLKMLKKNILAISIIIIALFCYFFNYVNDTVLNFFAYTLLIISGTLIWNNRKQLCFFLLSIFIAYSNYSICMGIYLYDFAPDYLFGQITNQNFYFIGIICLVIFNAMLLTIKFPVGKELYLLEKKEENKLVSIILIILILAIQVLNYLSIINIINLGIIGSIHEYSIILFILLFHYSGKNKKILIIYSIEVIIFSLMVFLKGDRCSAIVLIFAYIMYHYRKEENYLKYLPFIVIAIFLMISIGEIRTIEHLGNLSNILNDIIEKIRSEYLTFDTAIWAYFPSIESIWMAFQHSTLTRLQNFIELIMYIITGGFMNFHHLNILLDEYEFFQAGGYVTATYLYYYLGIVGIPIVPSIIITCINKIKKIKRENHNNSFFFLLVIYICSTVPRWYLYGIFTITRGILVFIVLTVIISIISKIKIKY